MNNLKHDRNGFQRIASATAHRVMPLALTADRQNPAGTLPSNRGGAIPGRPGEAGGGAGRSRLWVTA